MHGDTLQILGQSCARQRRGLHREAGDRFILGKPLLLHQQFQCRQPASADDDAVSAGRFAAVVQDRPHAKAVQQTFMRDVVRQFGDIDLPAGQADVAFVRLELVQRDNEGFAVEGDFRHGGPPAH
jgi:hypothetical protein